MNTSEIILVTGGTGFVGKHLLEYLKGLGFTNLHTTSLSGGESEVSGVAVHAVDLRDSQRTAALFEEVMPTQVYHLASIASVGNSFDIADTLLADNTALQVSVLNAAKKYVPNARFLQVSSAEVYGVSSQEELPITEQHPFKPINPYGVSKATQELLAAVYQRVFNMPIVIVRPFNHIGEGQSAAFALPAFAKQIVAIEKGAEPILSVGNLDAVRDFTDVKDVVKAYALLMEKGVVGEVYNLGSGTGVTMQSVLDQLLQLSTKKISVTVDPAKLRPLDIPVSFSDNGKLAQLGWKPSIALIETLERILESERNV